MRQTHDKLDANGLAMEACSEALPWGRAEMVNSLNVCPTVQHERDKFFEYNYFSLPGIFPSLVRTE